MKKEKIDPEHNKNEFSEVSRCSDSNAMLPPEHVVSLMEKEENKKKSKMKFCVELATDKNTKNDVLNWLSYFFNPLIDGCIVLNNNLETDTISQMYFKRSSTAPELSWETKNAIALHPNTSEEVMLDLLEDGYWMYIESMAKNPSSTFFILSTIYTSPYCSEDVKTYLLENPNIPEEILAKEHVVYAENLVLKIKEIIKKATSILLSSKDSADAFISLEWEIKQIALKMAIWERKHDKVFKRLSKEVCEETVSAIKDLLKEIGDATKEAKEILASEKEKEEGKEILIKKEFTDDVAEKVRKIREGLKFVATAVEKRLNSKENSKEKITILKITKNTLKELVDRSIEIKSRVEKNITETSMNNIEGLGEELEESIGEMKEVIKKIDAIMPELEMEIKNPKAS